MDFRWQLASALALNIALKVVTFSLATALTRRLSPDENGVNFAYQLYFNTVLFLARECVRNVNARHSLREHKGHSSSVLQVMNCAVLSVPLGLGVMAVLELLPKLGIHIFPALAALARVGDSSCAEAPSAAHCGIGPPEAVLALSVVLSLTAEPVIALAQSLDYVRVLITAEFWASLARLVVSLAAVCALGGLGGDPRTARLFFAAGMLTHAATTAAYFAWLWSADATLCGLRSSTKDSTKDSGRGDSERGDSGPLGSGIGGTGISFRAARAEASRGAALLLPFLGESCLRLVLTEGERFALTAFGSAAAMGHYDLIAGVGSLVARLVFRVWENACFAKWSRDTARGRPREAAALLFSMMRFAGHFGAAAVLVGPPLAEEFLLQLFSRRWASPAVVHALRLYCFLLPLLGWNGLLDGFARATAAPHTLRLTQCVMVTQALVYVGACFVVLRLQWFDNVVSGLIVTNIASMALRCLASLIMLLTRPIGDASGRTVLRLRIGDFAAVCNPRILAVWVALFLCTRWAMMAGLTVWIVSAAAPIFALTVVYWDAEVRVIVAVLLRGGQKHLAKE